LEGFSPSDSVRVLDARRGMRVLKPVIVALLSLALTGSARASVMPLAQDTVQITSYIAPVCGGAGAAQKVAFQRAAVETIRRGYDRFIILSGAGQTETRVLGYTPTTAHTTGTATATSFGNTATAIGSSTTTVTGGVPIVAHANNQDLIVKMFKQGDPAGANALDARQQLG
jgi:hypothetical protein